MFRSGCVCFYRLLGSVCWGANIEAFEKCVEYLDGRRFLPTPGGVALVQEVRRISKLSSPEKQQLVFWGRIFEFLKQESEQHFW